MAPIVELVVQERSNTERSYLTKNFPKQSPAIR